MLGVVLNEEIDGHFGKDLITSASICFQLFEPASKTKWVKSLLCSSMRQHLFCFEDHVMEATRSPMIATNTHF